MVIKEFTKESVALLESHKAPIDIKIGDQVFRDFEYRYIDRDGLIKLKNVGWYNTSKRTIFDKDCNKEVIDLLVVNGCDHWVKDDIRIHPAATFEFRTSRKWIKRERKRLGEAKRKIRAIAMYYNAPLMRKALEEMRVKPAVSFVFIPFKQK